MTTAELTRRVPLPWVLVELRYARGLRGTHWLILGRSGALILGHALAGDEGAEAARAPARAPRGDRRDGEPDPRRGRLGARARARPIDRLRAGLAAHRGDAASLPAELSAQLERLWLVRAEVAGPDGLQTDFTLTVGSDLAREIATLGAGASGAASVDLVDEREGQPPSDRTSSSTSRCPCPSRSAAPACRSRTSSSWSPGSIVELDKARPATPWRS